MINHCLKAVLTPQWKVFLSARGADGSLEEEIKKVPGGLKVEASCTPPVHTRHTRLHGDGRALLSFAPIHSYFFLIKINFTSSILTWQTTSTWLTRLMFVVIALALCCDAAKYNVHKYDCICPPRYFILEIAFILKTSWFLSVTFTDADRCAAS